MSVPRVQTSALAAHGVTHPGRVRTHNEDALLVSLDLGLFVVADGMGGERAGELAARLAIESVQSFIARSSHDPDHTWPFGIDGHMTYQGNRLRTAVKLANRRVYKEVESRNQFTGMGSTLSAVLIDGDQAVGCNVGDSRIYAVFADRLEQLTRDDTWIQTLLAQKPGLDPATLANHPMRRVLTSAIGAQDDLDLKVIMRTFGSEERLLICSDGVHGALAPEELRLLAWSHDPRVAAERLVATAVERDGKDNATAIVIARNSV